MFRIWSDNNCQVSSWRFSIILSWGSYIYNRREEQRIYLSRSPGFLYILYDWCMASIIYLRCSIIGNILTDKKMNLISFII